MIETTIGRKRRPAHLPPFDKKDGLRVNAFYEYNLNPTGSTGLCGVEDSPVARGLVYSMVIIAVVALGQAGIPKFAAAATAVILHG